VQDRIERKPADADEDWSIGVERRPVHRHGRHRNLRRLSAHRAAAGQRRVRLPGLRALRRGGQRSAGADAARGEVQLRVFCDDPVHLGPVPDSDAEIIDRAVAVQALGGKAVRGAVVLLNQIIGDEAG
jgi:hypothetical protein